MAYTYEYPRPGATVDTALFGIDTTNDTLKILLIQRKHDPYKNCWALPGGFIEMEESLKKSALRELEEETGLVVPDVKLFKVYGDPGRDPRGRTITTVYYTLVECKNFTPKAADDAENAAWFDLNNLPDLAFDHDTIIQETHNHLKMTISHYPAFKNILPDLFDIRDLTKLFNIILYTKIDDKILEEYLIKLELINAVRASYTFNHEKYAFYTKHGFPKTINWLSDDI